MLNYAHCQKLMNFEESLQPIFMFFMMALMVYYIVMLMQSFKMFCLGLTNIIATLALSSRLTQGLVKVWAKSEAQESHFMLSGVWEHSQMNSHFGSWSFDGLPNLQKMITGVKTHWLKSSSYHWKSFEM